MMYMYNVDVGGGVRRQTGTWTPCGPPPEMSPSACSSHHPPLARSAAFRKSRTTSRQTAAILATFRPWRCCNRRRRLLVRVRRWLVILLGIGGGWSGRGWRICTRYCGDGTSCARTTYLHIYTVTPTQHASVYSHTARTKSRGIRYNVTLHATWGAILLCFCCAHDRMAKEKTSVERSRYAKALSMDWPLPSNQEDAFEIFGRVYNATGTKSLSGGCGLCDLRWLHSCVFLPATPPCV